MFKLEFLQIKRLVFHFVIFLLGHTIIYNGHAGWNVTCSGRCDAAVSCHFFTDAVFDFVYHECKKIRRHQENEVKCCSILWTGGQKKFFCSTPIGYRIPNRFCWLVGRMARCFVAVVADYVRTRQHSGCRQADKNGRKESWMPWNVGQNGLMTDWG